MREVRKNSKCPCTSGRIYSECCKRKTLRWLIDDEGNFHKRIPLSSEVTEILKEASADFQRIFNREPKKNTDPVFLLKYLMSDEEVERKSIELMQLAGIQPNLIYAYRKTGGLLLTKENITLASTKDVEDWNDAIDEYDKLQKIQTDPDLRDSLFDLLNEELDACIICLGYVLEHGLDPNSVRLPSSSNFFTIDDYALVCATKSMKTLRSIKVLLEENIGADGLSLARHLLENYFHIVFALSRPEMLKHLTDAPIGLKLGTHDFARKSNGRIDARRILSKKDGAEYLGHISYYKMAESSPHHEDLELFDYMYSFLSEYTHPSFTGFQLVLGKEGQLNPLSNELQSEARLYSVCFSAMILDELRNLPTLTTEAKADICTVVSRVGEKAQALLKALFKEDGNIKSISALRDRLQRLGTLNSGI